MSFDLGGYGLYVWPAYAVTGIVLLGLLALSLWGVIAHERALARLQAVRRRNDARPDPLNAEDGRGDGG